MAKPTRQKERQRPDEQERPPTPRDLDLSEEGQEPPRRRKRKPPAQPQVPYEPEPPPPPQAQRRLALAPEEILHDEPPKERDVLDRIFGEALRRWQDKGESNKGVEAIGEIVSKIQGGQSLRDMQGALATVLGEQQSKALLVQASMFNHQLERVALHWDARWSLERSLWEDLKNQKLSPSEKLMLLKLSCQEADKAADYINDHSRVFQPLQEIEPVVERASKPVTDKELAEQKKAFEGTTPQGREIIRRFTSKAKRVADQIVGEKQKEPDGNGGTTKQ